ncbi:murein transglycosylase A [Almyronema epifaneia]|uniref:peptidoglycan lytic exotransglycosylase n=1 Tax=Almyronema epifaneia S1 TaxID=2991925 RepID=A0ABW6IIW3_9CYAN
MQYLKSLAWFLISAGLVIGLSVSPSLATLPLRPITFAAAQAIAVAPLGYDAELWGSEQTAADWRSLLAAIDHSLHYLATPQAAAAYAQYPVAPISRDRVQRSLRRFRQLVRTSPTPAALKAAVEREFTLYQAVGHDGAGTVDFTGYFEPSYPASRVRTDEYRYPLYRRPPDLESWPLPHPTRTELEGNDALQSNQGRLRGLELVWLRDRLQAFLIQVQGSARLELTDGTQMSVGYAGRTEYNYTSIGRSLIDAGKIAEADLTLPVLIDYFRQFPADLDVYLPRNQRFVFFRETYGSPPIGTLSVPVTAGRSIATDKTLMPPGALALINVALPVSQPDGTWVAETVSRYVLDQDTGGAIRGPGRVDLFMGSGAAAGDRAGLINTSGQLYYLLLKEN